MEEKDARRRATSAGLSEILFAQLERLSGDLTEDEMEREIGRSNAMTKVAREITANQKNVIDAARLKAEYATGKVDVARMLNG